MYGETPFHMAAKNGCSESARLLLAQGASLDAKVNNGMTPLHLAVWHALRAEDCKTEGMTPLNHLSESASREKLRGLLIKHMEEQRKCKAIESCSEAKAKMDEFKSAISGIIGLQDLKMQLRRWARGMLFDEKRRAFGLNMLQEGLHLWLSLVTLEQISEAKGGILFVDEA
ncbi:ankyrin-3-like isoform X3 [Zingiber officinale]|uniref:ankyrin-3-like isoform X3 n=1 Tax=Zingiber officinale TaxID=94328 RepID=UPI001C4C268A|nr:ankyrin-3-like isoform X3 [Zingiber officinale]